MNITSYWNQIALGLVAAVLVGCASTKQLALPPSASQPPDEQAMIIVKRSSSLVGGALSLRIADGSQQIGKVGVGGTVSWVRPPGLLALLVDFNYDTPALPVVQFMEVKKANTYTFRPRITLSGVRVHAEVPSGEQLLATRIYVHSAVNGVNANAFSVAMFPQKEPSQAFYVFSDAPNGAVFRARYSLYEGPTRASTRASGLGHFDREQSLDVLIENMQTGQKVYSDSLVLSTYGSNGWLDLRGLYENVSSYGNVYTKAGILGLVQAGILCPDGEVSKKASRVIK